MASLGSLVIELAANSARLTSDMGKAVGIVERGAARMTSVLKGLGSGLAVGGITDLALRSIELGDNLNKAAIKAGINGKAMSELAFAAKMADIDLSSLSNGIKKMQVALSEAASGGKDQVNTLHALGLEIKDIKGIGADRQFELIADRISQLKDPADRARAATDLFGKSGADLLPLFEQGAEGIRKTREEAERLGVSFSDKSLKSLADADDAIKRMKASWEGLTTSLTAKVAPALTRILDHLNELRDSKFSKFWGVLTNPLVGSVALGTSLALPSQRELDEAANSGRGRIIRKTDKSPPGFTDTEAAAKSAAAAAKEMEKAWDRHNDSQAKAALATLEYIQTAEEGTRTQSEQDKALFDQKVKFLDYLSSLDMINAQEYKVRWKEAYESLYPDIEEVETRNKRMTEEFINYFDQVPDRALEAADSARNAFENFFFDPMHDGIKGLARDLLNTLRQTLSKSIVDSLFGSKKSGGLGFGDAIAGGVSKFAKGLFGFADGGSFQVGGSGGTDSQLVAFRASPDERVTISKPGQSGGGIVYSPVTHINGSGLSQAQLAAVMERNNAAQLAKVSQLIRGGAFAYG